MNFTLEELYEIEKMADKAAGYCAANHADFIMKVTPAIEKLKDSSLKEFDQKVLKETVFYWDMMRTISAKCQQMRKEGKI